MQLLALLPVLFGAGAVAYAFVRAHVLTIRAPLAAAPFARALAALIARGEPERAAHLCASLRPAWCAEMAGSALAEANAGGDVRATIDEVGERVRGRADDDAYVLYVLARIAIPLSLGIAIVQLGVAFSTAEAAAIALDAAQGALQHALRCIATGVATAVFCRLARAALARQAAARLAELRIVSSALASQMSRTVR